MIFLNMFGEPFYPYKMLNGEELLCLFSVAFVFLLILIFFIGKLVKVKLTEKNSNQDSPIYQQTDLLLQEKNYANSIIRICLPFFPTAAKQGIGVRVFLFVMGLIFVFTPMQELLHIGWPFWQY